MKEQENCERKIKILSKQSRTDYNEKNKKRYSTGGNL